MIGLAVIRSSMSSVGRASLLTACLLFATACEKKPAGGGEAGGAAGGAAPAAGAVAPKTVAIIRAADWIGSQWVEDAIRVGLTEENLQEDRDYTFKETSAQGDLATLPSLLDNAVDEKASVIVALQDPTLKVAVERVKTVPVVFHVLSDPFTAGAGTSDSNHLANFTGVYSPGFGDPEQERRVALIKALVPKARRIGVLFSPDEPMAVSFKDKMIAAGKKAGLQVEAVPVPTANDGTDAANAILGKQVGAIEIYGNTAHAAFPAIIAAANAKKVPVLSASPFEMLKGAVAAIYPDFAEGGIQAGHMIGRILKGESAGKIPFFKVTTVKTTVSPSNAKNSNVTIPPNVMKGADTVGVSHP